METNENMLLAMNGISHSFLPPSIGFTNTNKGENPFAQHKIPPYQLPFKTF